MHIQRKLYKKIEPYIDSPETIVITGMRRVGKTTLLKTIFESISSKNKIFLDLENPINQKYFEELNFDNIIQSFKQLGLTFNNTAYVFLDEIQLIKNLPQIIKYLSDNYKIKFFCTGSSSFYLKNLFSESLAGRKYIFEMFPLDFEEFLKLKEEKLTILKETPIQISTYETLKYLYDEYVEFGGFPGVVSKETIEEKKKALEDIFTSYFQLEVIQLGDFKKTKAMRDLILLLTKRVGSKLNVQRLHSILGISRETVNEYIAFLEGTYLFSFIKPYSKSPDVEIRGAPKVYMCDSGLLNQLAGIEKGAVFENNIFQLLRCKSSTIHYFQKKSGIEIDFIVNKEHAYEVKTSGAQTDVNRLIKMSKELNLKKAHVISKSFFENEHVTYGFNLWL